MSGSGGAAAECGEPLQGGCPVSRGNLGLEGVAVAHFGGDGLESEVGHVLHDFIGYLEAQAGGGGKVPAVNESVERHEAGEGGPW